MNTLKLNDGHTMPQLGFGVFQITDLNQAQQAVEQALANGYRLIDTAEAYQNQTAVGKAMQNSNVNRDEIFLTTKLWVSNFSYQKAAAAIDQDLKELNTDYLDLMLLHQAYGDVYGAWRALEDAQAAGKIKSIGVSNFWPDQVKNLELGNHVKPAVNQIEINPWFQRPAEVKFYQDEGIAVEAWAPFAEGKNHLFTNPTLVEIGEKYGKSSGQVVLRYLLQQGIVVVAKSVHDARQKENINVFDFELSTDDMAAIAQLDQGHSQFFDHHDPATIEQIFGPSLKELR